MALLFEVLSSVLVYLMTKPLQLLNLFIRSAFVVLQTWIELLRAAFHLHLFILWKLLVWTIAVLSLPTRAFTALCRQRLLEMRMYRMRNELEIVAWERKELEGRLQSAVKERRTVEAMLMELEDEHDEAILKIQQLEGQVRDLKEEIRRLKEVQGKVIWDHRVQADGDIDNDDFGTSSWKSSNTKNTSQDAWQNKMTDVVKSGPHVLNHHPQKSTPYMISKDANFLVKQRQIALSRSLISAIMSLVVGIVVWEAENPCMPLVVALYIVVGMSLMSVVRFFSIIDHKTASDAVALLCLNCFMLGMLTYPTLPRVARVSGPLASCLVERVFVMLLS